MNKEEIYAYLSSKGIPYEIAEHKAVYNMNDLDNLALPYPEANAKNLFVRDKKKSRYSLITVKGEKRVDLRDFHRVNNARALSLASAEDLFELLRLTPGSVTPLGLLNDEKKTVEFYLDSDLRDGLIACHPNDNTATIFLACRDLLSIIEEHGNPVYIVDI